MTNRYVMETFYRTLNSIEKQIVDSAVREAFMDLSST